MKGETMQTLSQITIAIGIILTAIGGYGNFYYGRKLDAKSNTENNKKLDEIKNSIEEAISSDGSMIKNISYPHQGEFGSNILNEEVIEINSGTYSMRVELPKNEKIFVKLSGQNWGYPVFQPIPGWKPSQLERNGSDNMRIFETIKFGIIDLEMHLNSPDTIESTMYKNDLDNEIRSKSIIIND